MEGSGGAFLSTLKEKNERQRLARQRTATASSMRDATKSRKSFFGSFFGLGNGSNRKNSSGTSDSMRQAAREASFEQDEPQMDGSEKIDIDTATILLEESVILHENNEKGSAITIVNKQEAALPELVLAIASKSNERSDITQKTAPYLESPPSPQVIREVSSTGKLETETLAHQSAVQIVRQRRVSTTVGTSSRRMSSSIVEHAVESSGYGRERTPSVATMEEVYGRTARDPRNFEMTNPLLVDPSKSSSSRNGGMSVTQSAADIDMERAKRASLYNSAPHVDQAMLLDRRNTRAGRTGSMDVRDRSSTMEQPVEALS